MSSTEPPSRIPPRQQTHETKSARDELSSKGKVEKVREIDADEQTKKKRFMKYYRGIEEDEEPQEGAGRPSPFDLLSGKSEDTGADSSSLGASSSDSDLPDVDDTVIPGPSYSPPPNVNAAPAGAAGEEGIEDDESTIGALPQSDDFWEDYNLPDEPLQPTTFREMPAASTAPKGAAHPEGKGTPTVGEHRKRVKEIHKREEEIGLLKGKVEKKAEVHEKIEKKKTEPSVFGPPGKPAEKEKRAPIEPLQPHLKQGARLKETEKEKEERPWVAAPVEKQRELRREPVGKSKEEIKAKKLPTPMEELSRPPQPKAKEMREAAPMARPKEKEKKKEEEEIVIPVPREIGAAPVTPPEGREGRGGGRQGREEKVFEIEAPSLPQLPANIQPMAVAATSQAATYLAPQTVSLFFQMVGTIFVMQAPEGINRTEVVLNNPAYANSKFYGATITIEKYATAPDSFNIRLTGSHEAVASFKENIPSLLNAFENGNFNFRIGRIDVEYSLERPIFRRKEKGEGRGEAGGGDLGERRNK